MTALNKFKEEKELAHYMIVGVERTGTKGTRRGSDLSNVPRHLIQTKNLYGSTYQEVICPRYDAPVSIIDVDKIKNGQVNIIKISINDVDKFKEQYGLAHAPKKLDNYGSTNIPDNQPMIIINKIDDIGYQCVDVTGKVINLRNADVLRYANTWGIANAKVYEKLGYSNNTLVISGIGWIIPTISIEQLKNSANNTVKTPNKLSEKSRTNEQRLEIYRKKLQLLGTDSRMFEIDFNTLTLTKCKPGKYDRLTLPPVKVIGWDAFRDVSAEELVIPNSVENIGKDAFSDSDITTLIMQANIQKLGGNSLHFNRLKHLMVGENVQSELSIKGVQSRSLEDVEVDEHNKWFISEDGIAYTKGLTRLINYPSNHSQAVYNMPNTVCGTLDTHTFSRTANLKRIAVSDGIKRIEPEAFWCGDKLEEIILGTGLQEIQPRAIVISSVLKQIRVYSNVELQANKHYVQDNVYYTYDGEQISKVNVIYVSKKPQKIIESEQKAEEIIKELFSYMNWKWEA